MAAGTVAARSAAIQAVASMAGPVVGPARHRARSAPVMTVTGLALAKACSQPGMVATGTRAELVKNKMMTGNRPASPADSGSRTARPSSRLSQENASPAATARATAARAAAGPAWNRNPAAAPAAIIRPTTNRLRRASAATRPARGGGHRVLRVVRAGWTTAGGPPPGGVRLGGWPVRARNASSRVARRRASPLTCRPAAASRAATVGRTPGPSATGRTTRPAAKRRQRRCRLPRVLTGRGLQVQPVPSGPGPELAGGAGCDDLAVVNDDDRPGEPFGFLDVLGG